MKNLKTTLLTAFVVVAFAGIVNAQDNSKPPKEVSAAHIKQLADEKKLVFKAEYVNARGGLGERNSTFFNKNNSNRGDNHITLKGDFSLSLKPDSVSSFLPIGDADYRNPRPFDDYKNPVVRGFGFKFTSARYNYVVKQQKHGDVDVTIDMPNDSHIARFFLEMGADGNAKLTMTTTHGQTISYAGKVVEQI